MNGPQLREWREHWQLSQGELATALGVVLNTIGRWERSERDMPNYLPLALESLERRLAAALQDRAKRAAQGYLTNRHQPAGSTVTNQPAP